MGLTPSPCYIKHPSKILTLKLLLRLFFSLIPLNFRWLIFKSLAQIVLQCVPTIFVLAQPAVPRKTKFQGACIGWATGWGSLMPAGAPGQETFLPGLLLEPGLAHSTGWGSLNLREGKTKLGFSGRISFHSKLTPVKRRTQVLHAGWNTGACVQLWEPLKKADSSEHAVLGAISKSWTITKKKKN